MNKNKKRKLKAISDIRHYPVQLLVADEAAEFNNHTGSSNRWQTTD